MQTPDRRRTPVSSALPVLRIAILAFMPILGLFGGAWYALAANSGALLKWQALGTPPDKATEILGAELTKGHRRPGSLLGITGTVYVRTEADRVYYCTPASDEKCWVKTTWPQTIQQYPPCISPPDFAVAKPPGKAVDSIQVQDCSGEVAAQVNFVVLEDGSVWMWEHDITGLDNLARFVFCTLCNSILGLVASVLLIKRIGRNQITQTQSPEGKAAG